MHHWFDAHLDLACLAVNGRDMTADLATCGGPWPPPSVTLPTLRDGGVACALGTIFTEMGGGGPEGYPEGDSEKAHRRGRAQMEVYETWRDMGLVRTDLRSALRVDQQVGAIRGGMGVSEVVPEPTAARLARDGRLCMGVLIECADPVRTPDELSWWVDRGVVAVGMAWGKGSRYAGGNATPGVGISDLGRAFAQACDALGVAHDFSHLSQRACDELLEIAEGPVFASHSNCRGLFSAEEAMNERHLSDATIRAIGERGGVVGVNLVSNFLREGLNKDAGERASIGDVVAHIERICELMGRRDGVAIGTDMDGGFSADWLPEGVRRPADLETIATALGERGWSDEELSGFRFGNWARFFA